MIGGRRGSGTANGFFTHAASRLHRDVQWIHCVGAPWPEYNVAVLNLDEYGEVGNANAVVDSNLIRGLVKRGLEKFGEFARLQV